MMADSQYMILILGMGVVTYVPRWLPFYLLSRRTPPQLLVEWLDFIPAAILAAILLPALVTTGDPKTFSLMRPDLWVALPTFLFAAVTRSLGGTVIVGMTLYWLADKFF